MTSAIDSTIPTAVSATTASVRANFAVAASEITALQATDLLKLAKANDTATGVTVTPGTFTALSNNVAQETLQATTPTCLVVADGSSGTPNSTSHHPALWVQKYVSAGQTTEGSQQVSGAFLDVEVSGSGSAASPTKGAYIGLLASVNTKGANTGTSLAPTWDTKGDTVGVAGFARNTGVPQDGHIITGLWGWAQAPTLDATTYANLTAANWSVCGCEVNVTLHGNDIGVKTSLSGSGSSVGYLANNYRAPSAGVLDWTFGMVLAGTPDDGNYSSTDIANWNGYRTGILIDKVKNYGINFGTYYANSSYCIKFADTYAGSTEPAAAIYLGNNKINMGAYTGATFANKDFYSTSTALIVRYTGVAEQIVTNRSNVTTAPSTVWTINDSAATAMFAMGSVASAVNNFKVFSAATLGAPALVVQGTDSNINLELRPKGTGNVFVNSGGIAITGNSTITGTLGSLTGLTVASGGVTVTGNSNITGTLGSLTGLTVASGNATVSTGNIAASAGSVTAGTTVTATTFLISGISTGLTAAGNSQGTALALTRNFNEVTTAAASTGVILPAATAGTEIIVFNRGANTLSVYPNSSAKIDAGSTNAAVTLATTVKGRYICASATQWYTG